MIESKELIEEVIEDKTDVSLSVRSIACEAEQWSVFAPLIPDSKKFIFNSKLIDGVKLRMNNFVLKLNKRHNFK